MRRAVKRYGVGHKRCLFGRSIPHPLAGGIAQPETSGGGHARIEVLEVNKHGFNLVAYPAVIFNQIQPPGCAALANRDMGQSGNNGGL